MSDTKEAILITALHLFAKEGYEAVSVSRIAGALEMTKGALYKHYQSKRDMFHAWRRWIPDRQLNLNFRKELWRK